MLRIISLLASRYLTWPTRSHVEDVACRGRVPRAELTGKRRSRYAAPDHRNFLGGLATDHARDHTYHASVGFSYHVC